MRLMTTRLLTMWHELVLGKWQSRWQCKVKWIKSSHTSLETGLQSCGLPRKTMHSPTSYQNLLAVSLIANILLQLYVVCMVLWLYIVFEKECFLNSDCFFFRYSSEGIHMHSKTLSVQIKSLYSRGIVMFKVKNSSVSLAHKPMKLHQEDESS